MINWAEINWDPNAAGNWPLPIKAGAIAIICALVAVAGVYWITFPQLDELAELEKKEKELRVGFEFKQKKAINLPDYQDQLAEIEVSLGEMIKQMPTKAEIANLLIDISQTGLANGLEFKLFQPGAEEHKEFYTELPIAIEVIGRYAQLSSFISGLASLPRVVTVHDVTIKALNADPHKEQIEDAKQTKLWMKATVKTYNERGSSSSADAAKVIRKGG